MNRRQRDANRATARRARWILHGARQSFGGTAGTGSMVLRSSRDLIQSTTPLPTFAMLDDLEQVIPEGAIDGLRAAVWHSMAEAYQIPLWVGDGDMATIRLALSNRLTDPGWSGNPPPCWSEPTRVAYCRQQGIPLDTPEQTCRDLNRYGHLCGSASRNDAEQAEMESLRASLAAAGIVPGWEEVPRCEITDEELDVFSVRKERPWHS